MRVLVAPLDWGLGHATRCIPIIRELLKQGAEVLIAADGRGLSLLQQEFPGQPTVLLPGYGIRYSGRHSMALQVLLSVPRIFFRIYAEHRQLNALIASEKLDAVLSDNRYGLWSDKVYSVIITHQIAIKCPPGLRFLESVLKRITGFFISKYDCCWVPDTKEEDGLSGELSHNTGQAGLKFIGPLSRFYGASAKEPCTQKKYDLLVTLSGPEPQRSIFEKLVMEQLKKSTLKTMLVSGVPGEPVSAVYGTDIFSHLSSDEMYHALMGADMVLSRPGYSTVMDLAAIGKTAVFVPTPGQTEQEYLAASLKRKGLFYSVSQRKFNLEYALAEARNYPGLKLETDPKLLSEAVRELLNRTGALSDGFKEHNACGDRNIQ